MFFIFVLYLVGISLYLDYTTWWFDMVLHFLGGFWVGCFFIYLFARRVSLLNPSSRVIVNVILCVLFIALSWEAFEFYVNNMIGRFPFSVSDTTSDVFLGLAGGVCSMLYFFKGRKQEDKQVTN